MNLSIKNVPTPVVEKLRARAAQNHRSLQGELMALVCQAVEVSDSSAKETRLQTVESGWKSIEEILADRLSAHPEAHTEGPSAVDIIREERDAR